MRQLLYACIAALLTVGTGAPAQQLTVTRGAATVSVEGYAPNIVRVTLSLDSQRALAKPGYGITAQADARDWGVTSDDRSDVLKSSQMVVRVAKPEKPGKPVATQLDIAKF